MEIARAEKPLVFPYVPGLLSFREGPAVLAAFDKLSRAPDLVMFDGQGIAHPRRLGIAAHMGVLLDLPSLGVAKSILTGRGPDPGPEPGDWSPLDAQRRGRSARPLRTKRESQAGLHLHRPPSRPAAGAALGDGRLPGLPPAGADPPRPQRRRRGR